jgi:hypothetical protein
MRRLKLHEMTSEQLVEQFATIGVKQYDAILWDEIAKYNRLFEQKMAIMAELKSRPGDHRNLLVSLFDHDNVQVRLNAAKATLAVAPQAARQMLETIAGASKGPQGGDAGMCLWNLDRGVFKPT